MKNAARKSIGTHCDKFVQLVRAHHKVKKCHSSQRSMLMMLAGMRESVLGHYLPSSLSSFRNCVNFIQNNFTMSKSQCKRIFDLAAAISISSSRRIFMA